MEELGTAEEGCYHPNDEVEAEEDGLLCRTGGEAVHGVGAGKAAAGELGLHLEAVELPLAHEKPDFGQNPEQHIDNVKPPEVDVFAGPAIEFGVLLVVVVHGVNEEEQRRRADEDDVKHPESVLRDGEGHVITHLFAAGLEGVAGKLLLFVLKQVTGDSSKDHDPKDEHEQEPEATQHGRVVLEAVEERTEEAPFRHVCSTFWAFIQRF